MSYLLQLSVGCQTSGAHSGRGKERGCQCVSSSVPLPRYGGPQTTCAGTARADVLCTCHYAQQSQPAWWIGSVLCCREHEDCGLRVDATVLGQFSIVFCENVADPVERLNTCICVFLIRSLQYHFCITLFKQLDLLGRRRLFLGIRPATPREVPEGKRLGEVFVVEMDTMP